MSEVLAAQIALLHSFAYSYKTLEASVEDCDDTALRHVNIAPLLHASSICWYTMLFQMLPVLAERA